MARSDVRYVVPSYVASIMAKSGGWRSGGDGIEALYVLAQEQDLRGTNKCDISLSDTSYTASGQWSREWLVMVVCKISPIGF
jgi:hypothetical protein